MKIILLGHMRSGKDTTAEILQEMYGITYKSSSQAAAEIFIFDELKEKYGYKTFEECFEDRVNHRSEWYDLICEYNKDDKARLFKEITKDGSMYIGMRDNEELQACRPFIDLVIAVFDPRKPLEDDSSFNIDIYSADIIIPNSGTIEDLRRKLYNLRGLFFQTQIVKKR